ncbi:hypothetical protein OHV74_17715, partial [Acinetobacter baumannii]|nr:hypothetical protein [Acinetobacter baumannii]
MALTPEIFRNLERDIDDVDKTLNTKGIITPRYGAPFKSLPLALEKVENNGGYISAPTLAALQAITPTYNHQVARVDATGDEYRWNPNASPAPKWEPTGRNYLNESKTYTDQKVLDLNTNIEGVLTGEVLPYIDNGDDLVQAAAAMDATNKANTAKSEAIDAAAIDATNKANTAKSEAIDAAATDATNKANTAESNAKDYADSNANFTFKVLTETDHLDDLKVSGTYTALNTIVASTSRG